jgi:hypothetical protein
MHSGRSITAIVFFTIVLLIAGFLVAVMIFAHVVGRTTAIRPRAERAAS